MTTPLWLTVLVAVLGPIATLAGQWMAGVRQVKLANVERDVRRDERAEQRQEQDRRLRAECYATLLIAARALRDTVARTAANSVDIAAVIDALRDAAVVVGLRAPTLADEVLPAVMKRGEQLTTVRLSGASVQIITNAAGNFDQSVAALRQAMRTDVAAIDS